MNFRKKLGKTLCSLVTELQGYGASLPVHHHKGAPEGMNLPGRDAEMRLAESQRPSGLWA